MTIFESIMENLFKWILLISAIRISIMHPDKVKPSATFGRSDVKHSKAGRSDIDQLTTILNDPTGVNMEKIGKEPPDKACKDKIVGELCHEIALVNQCDHFERSFYYRRLCEKSCRACVQKTTDPTFNDDEGFFKDHNVEREGMWIYRYLNKDLSNKGQEMSKTHSTRQI